MVRNVARRPGNPAGTKSRPTAGERAKKRRSITIRETCAHALRPIVRLTVRRRYSTAQQDTAEDGRRIERRRRGPKEIGTLNRPAGRVRDQRRRRRHRRDQTLAGARRLPTAGNGRTAGSRQRNVMTVTRNTQHAARLGTRRTRLSPARRGMIARLRIVAARRGGCALIDLVAAIATFRPGVDAHRPIAARAEIQRHCAPRKELRADQDQ